MATALAKIRSGGQLHSVSIVRPVIPRHDSVSELRHAEKRFATGYAAKGVADKVPPEGSDDKAPQSRQRATRGDMSRRTKLTAAAADEEDHPKDLVKTPKEIAQLVINEVLYQSGW